MTTKQMKEIYEANPDEWIALWSATIGWMKHGAWLKTSTPAFIDENHYKLIHIKHKDILSAWLADNSVEIEFRYGIGTKFESTWNTSSYFIENYNPDLEYRLRDKSSWCKECNMYKRDCICRIKEKEDVKTLSKQSSQSISSELSDSSNTSDIGLPNINSFTAHGFEVPDFEGEIFYINNKYGTIHGIVLEEGSSYSIEWNHAGQVLNITLSRGVKSYNLTPIKKEWYENPENFPAMLIRDTEERMGYIQVDNKEQFIKRHRQGFRLITKAERDRLFCKE